MSLGSKGGKLMNRNMCKNHCRPFECDNICIIPCCKKWQEKGHEENKCKEFSKCQCKKGQMEYHKPEWNNYEKESMGYNEYSKCEEY